MKLNFSKSMVYGVLGLVIVTGSIFAYTLRRVVSTGQPVSSGSFKKILHTPIIISPLDGLPASSSAAQVIGVMIDNHPDARPQSGVAQAKIVYETMVEGGITRYFALYDVAQQVDQIGPVRSARLYFLDWIQEYGDGLYVHSGGSPQALAAIKLRHVFDANEFFWGRYFWRDDRNFAPHNLYTSTEKLRAMIEYRGVSTTLFTQEDAWKYGTDITVASSSAGVSIDFNSAYQVQWRYDPDLSLYQRVRNGRTEKDSDGKLVQAHNVIVQIADVDDIANDDKGRQEIATVGSGEAWVFKKGIVIHGTWKKKTTAGRTRFFDDVGKEIMLTPGNTWVEVAPKEAVVNFK
jgi:hypothetical protein